MKRLLIFMAVLSAITLRAQIQGTWNAQDASVPQSVDFVWSTDGQHVVGINGGQNFGLDTLNFQIDANGNFNSPGGPAQVQPLNNGEDLIVVSGGPTFPIAFNTNGDVCCGTFADSDSFHHLLMLKAPNSLSTAQLAGTWQVFSWDAPAQLIPIYDTNNNDIVGIEGTQYDPIGSTWQPAIIGSLTVDSAGSFTGNVKGPASGTVTAGSSGQVTISVNDTTPFQFTGYINQSLDVIAAANLNEPNTLEYDLLVKTVSPATAEMAGVWHVSKIQVPSGISTNLVFNGNFDAASFTVIAGYDGTLTVRNPNGTERATWSPNATGMTINTGDGAMPALVSQSKTVLIVNEGRALDVAVKFPVITQGVRDMGLVSSGTGFGWAPQTTNTVLQSSSSPSGPWTDVPGTEGASNYTPTNNSAAEYFRVKQ